MPFEADEQPAVAADTQSVYINDFQFVAAVRRLKSLRTFMQQAGVARGVDIGGRASSLYTLKFGQDGRPPTPDEWERVETLTEDSFSSVPEALRRKFFLGEIPSWVAIAPIGLAILALIALVGAVFAFVHYTTVMLPCYLVWLMALGAIGSVAFIGMNALSVQQDITFDLNNGRLMVLRIVLGALFGLVLTLPFGFPEFYGFIKYLNGISNTAAKIATTDSEMNIGGVSSRALALLMPFVLGFSTSLVIMILNRLVDAVQAFFGKQATTESASPSSTRSSSYSTSYGPSRGLSSPPSGYGASPGRPPSTTGSASVPPTSA